MDAMVPSLMVQPLLENAIYHGIERLANGGEVTIDASLHEGKIRLAVANLIKVQSKDGSIGVHVPHDGTTYAVSTDVSDGHQDVSVCVDSTRFAGSASTLSMCIQ